MKRIQSVLLAFSMLFLLTACSNREEPSQESGGQITNPSSQQEGSFSVRSSFGA